jgi:DNA-binding NarL/FixJ family response regulator
MPFSIVLVDDHKLVRDGVKTILERGSEFHVVGEAENGPDAVVLCRKAPPDLVLMDIGLPGMNGIEATTELLRHCPGIKVVILSMYDDENSVVAAIRSGARAFVLRDSGGLYAVYLLLWQLFLFSLLFL